MFLNTGNSIASFPLGPAPRCIGQKGDSFTVTIMIIQDGVVTGNERQVRSQNELYRKL